MLFQAGLVFPENLPEIQILILMYPRDREIFISKMPDSSKNVR